MKFLESTNFFVRTIMFDFVNRDKKVKLRFRLVPVIHIGSSAFYKSVFDNLNECDEVFYEGSMLKENRFFSNQYKTISERLNLVTQNECLKLDKLDVKLTHTDYTIKSGRIQWKKLKFMERIRSKYFYPVKFFLEGRNLTRARLAKLFMTSNEDLALVYGPREDEEGTICNLIMAEREKIIFNNIASKLEVASMEDKLIGIIYGAGHMKSIARFLIDKHNYYPNNGRFMKVFTVL